uniref:Uncharacterized protein n=1 Tax=Arundo donax TaxID=35708 RepID=A0A0A9EQL2_ARUDO
MFTAILLHHHHHHLLTRCGLLRGHLLHNFIFHHLESEHPFGRLLPPPSRGGLQFIRSRDRSSSTSITAIGDTFQLLRNLARDLARLRRQGTGLLRAHCAVHLTQTVPRRPTAPS